VGIARRPFPSGHCVRMPVGWLKRRPFTVRLSAGTLPATRVARGNSGTFGIWFMTCMSVKLLTSLADWER
jgi:hypothetical protein